MQTPLSDSVIGGGFYDEDRFFTDRNSTSTGVLMDAFGGSYGFGSFMNYDDELFAGEEGPILCGAVHSTDAVAAGGGGSFSSSTSSIYPFISEMMSDITDQLPQQARAIAASKNHREAEKRRRERINSHLNKLRSLLPCNSKTDKASLLAKVIEHVKDLKQQTMEISQLELFPSETDEIKVYAGNHGSRSVFKASLCCEDRADLLPDLIETLKSLRLKTLRAEMATLGGRVRNVLVVTGEDQDHLNLHHDHNCDNESVSIGFLRDALKSLVGRSSSSDRHSKKRRINNVDRRTSSTAATTTTSSTTTTTLT